MCLVAFVLLGCAQVAELETSLGNVVLLGLDYAFALNSGHILRSLYTRRIQDLDVTSSLLPRRSWLAKRPPIPWLPRNRTAPQAPLHPNPRAALTRQAVPRSAGRRGNNLHLILGELAGQGGFAGGEASENTSRFL